MTKTRERHVPSPDPLGSPLSGSKLLAYHDGPGLGGSEVALATLLRNLDAHIHVAVVADDPQVARWFAHQLPSCRVSSIEPVGNKWDIRGMLAHLQAIRRIAPDVLHINLQTPWSGKYAILAGLLLRRVKTVAVEHTEMPPYNRQALWAKRILMRTTSANVAVSAHLARWLEEAAWLRRGSVRVIYNGVSDVEPAQGEPRATGPPVVGTIARLTRQKGVDVFLRALAQVPNARAVVVGDGEDRVALEQLAKELGIDDRVTWMGWRDDARTLLTSFDVFVLASRFEGLGLALIEAALAERPIVATSVDGTPEVVVHGETGILVPPDDPPALARAISELLADRERARGLGRRARVFALDRFDVGTMVEAYERLYLELVGARPAHS